VTARVGHAGVLPVDAAWADGSRERGAGLGDVRGGVTAWRSTGPADVCALAPGGSPLDPALDAYLDALAAALDLPSQERLEVRDDIGAHLLDLRSELAEAA